MSYTVNKLAKLSGISIRTLRFYDAIGLLKPAYYGDILLDCGQGHVVKIYPLKVMLSDGFM